MQRFFAIAALLLTTTAAFSEQRLALVIGNDNYEHLPDLTRAVNDANAMGDVFKELGFTVTKGTDLDKKSWSDMAQNFASALEKESTAVVYVASHGLNVSGVQYVAPVDVPESAAKGTVDDMLASSINFDEFLDALGTTQAKTLIVIFDSCRNNPFKKHTRGLGKTSDTRQDVAILFSAAPGACPFESVNSADTSPNSPFVRFLVEELRKPPASLSKISSKIRLDIYNTGLDQQPWYHEGSSGEITLHPKP
jgi:uncharacterized caspase-like protein